MENESSPLLFGIFGRRAGGLTKIFVSFLRIFRAICDIYSSSFKKKDDDPSKNWNRRLAK